MSPPTAAALARCLDELSRRTDRAGRLKADPIALPRRFQAPRDIELAGWLAASLAYGRVPLFTAALERILEALGGRPFAFVSAFVPRRDLPLFEGLGYRMNRGRDIACLLYLMRRVLDEHGSVGALFQSFCREEDEDVGPALERFVAHVRAYDVSPVYGRNRRPRGLTQLLSSPTKGSACKRLNLYLRWMVRPDDGVDFGLWKGVSPSKLVVPLDTHLLRIGRYLGLTRRRAGGWSAALDVTRGLRIADPADPVRFDFPLCHLGISGACPLDDQPAKCAACPLLPVCRKGRRLLR